MPSNKLNRLIQVFSPADWTLIDKWMADVAKATAILEEPDYGDSRHERVTLQVARMIVRRNGVSQQINEPYSSRLLSILAKARLLEKVAQETQSPPLAILRLQANLMYTGSFIGVHTDQESDPAYQKTIIIRAHSQYSGGELCLFGNPERTIIQPSHSVFVMDSTIEHEVKPVTSGYRFSICAWLGLQ